jgi:serine/threonine-protein kinase
MGQVYLAEHITMRRLVALKVLPPYSFDDAVARERFFREARAAGTLDHPNVVRVYDLCQEGKLLFLVMEYVEGVSIQTVVSRHGPLPVAAACHYARQVAFGLQHAFELGFVHRDIKPANLLLDPQGVVKILDLGLVRSEAEVNVGLTKQLDNKSILGTADYVAPEQAVDSSRVDIRADVYALGATLYFMLAGRPLFPEGRTAQKLVWQQIKEPVPVDDPEETGRSLSDAHPGVRRPGPVRPGRRATAGPGLVSRTGDPRRPFPARDGKFKRPPRGYHVADPRRGHAVNRFRLDT